MKLSKLSSLLLIAGVFAGSRSLTAQNPTPAQAQQMLQNNPALLQQLRQRIITSGLTPDQVRARLRAEGYPETLLDAYLPGGSGSAADNSAPDEEVYSAITKLGIADTAEVDMLRCGITADSLQVPDTLVNGMVDTAVIVRRRADRRAQLQARCIAQEDSIMNGLKPGATAAPSDSGFTIFGLDFFRNRSTAFNPNLTGPVDASYKISPGDQLALILTGDVEQSYSLPVTREGFIVIPQVGQVYVNNLTLGELENVLYSRLGRVYSGVRRGPGATTRFSITPSRLGSLQIYVTGDVLRPGSYRISSAATSLTALYAAMGPSDNGSLRQILVRGGGRVDTLDVYDYLLNGNTTRDVRLTNGDLVFVPVHGARVRIVGQVTRPATYEIRPGETLADALRFAGGFTATASRRRVQIERIVPPEQRTPGGRDRIVSEVVSDAFLTGGAPTIAIEPGDIIRVFSVASRVRNRVTVSGDVWSPGSVGISSGMRVSEALRLAGGVKPDVYLGQVLITRTNPDSTRLQLRAALRDTTGAVINDLPLQEDDEIRVFSVSEFRPTRYVAINGAVRRSGQFPYREGMTVRDLVLLAGGLDQSAYLNEAEVARLPENRAGGATAQTFRVPLDSSYIFERGPDGKYLGPPGQPAPSGPNPEVVVQPYDNVLILRQPNWELQRTAVIAGEVKYPGRYSLKTKTEKITDLIERAGGLTPDAYANGVTFYRKRNGVGRIGIELPDVLKNSKSPDNLPLQDGDSLFIPRYNAVVAVQGAVNSPVSVTYSPGKSIQYYIRAAGGPSLKADVGRAYVTQPNGKVEARQSHFLLPDAIPHPLPGSTVFVPERDPSAQSSSAAFAATVGLIAQIAAGLATLVLAIRH
ncbi:MAG TPA: SLBB domain-containing protein [Gemmatimonadaceae bacterium]|nr:SLBB domain-containing protein [Gemmatimonadaceae bacterium]